MITVTWIILNDLGSSGTVAGNLITSFIGVWMSSVTANLTLNTKISTWLQTLSALPTWGKCFLHICLNRYVENWWPLASNLHSERNRLTKTEHVSEHQWEHSRWQQPLSVWHHSFGSLLNPRWTHTDIRLMPTICTLCSIISCFFAFLFVCFLLFNAFFCLQIESVQSLLLIMYGFVQVCRWTPAYCCRWAVASCLDWLA